MILCLVGLSLSVTTVHAAIKTTKHSCAPSIPASVAGPLIQPQPVAGLVLINEVLLTPHSLWNCSSAQVKNTAENTWVELYNPQNQAYDLYGGHATLDGGPGTPSNYFPFGAAIAAHSFLVVFPLINSRAPIQNTQIALTLRLLLADTPINQVNIPPLAPDTSYARMQDGGSSWITTNKPTIDASNILPASVPTISATKTSRGSKDKNGAGNNTPAGTNSPSGQHNGSNTGSRTPARGQNTGTANTSNNGATQTAGADTSQPWGALQLPTATKVAPQTTARAASFKSSPAPAQVQATGEMNLQQKILLTLLAVGLGLALLWCRKLFTSS